MSRHENNWVCAKEVQEERKQLLQNFLQKFGVTGEFEDENGHANGVNPVISRLPGCPPSLPPSLMNTGQPTAPPDARARATQDWLRVERVIGARTRRGNQVKAKL